MGGSTQLTRMKATARRDGGSFKHTVQVREHQLTVDEPIGEGGEDLGPDPRELLAVSLASCTAITMEMYAARKGWELGPVEVDVEYSPAERGCPTKFMLVMRLPDDMPEEQVERLRSSPRSARCTARSTARSCSRSALSAFTWPPDPSVFGAAGLPDRADEIPAAVLVPIFLAVEAGDPHLVLTRRRADLRRHAGEISFPGGRGDAEDAALSERALREAEEEIGLPRADVRLLGQLPPTSTFATNYVIHPFVGLIPEGRAWRLSAREVEP